MNSQLNSICMYKGCNITKYIANTFLPTTPFSNNLLQGSYLPKKKSEQMFVISHYFGPNSFGKPESSYIYMDIQIYIKYNHDSYRLHVMGKGVGVCVKNLIGDVHCANYMYGEQKAKRK